MFNLLDALKALPIPLQKQNVESVCNSVIKEQEINQGNQLLCKHSPHYPQVFFKLSIICSVNLPNRVRINQVQPLYLMQARPTHLFIAVSLDGFIADANDDLSFLGKVEAPGEDYGYTAFMENVDTVVMGRRTYDKVMSMGVPFPHADRPCYVITRTPREPIGQTFFHTGDPAALIRELRNKPGGIVFVDGGALVVNRLLQERLIDGITLSIIPVLLGDGIRLFSEGGLMQDLELLDHRAYPSGLVQLRYRIKPGS